MKLNTQIKSYNFDSARIKSPKDTVQEVTKRIQELKLPVYNEIIEITDYDVLGIPVFATTHNNIPEVNKKPSWGKGSTKEQARASAIMERVERFSSTYVDKNKLIKARFIDIKDKAISRWDFVPCNLQKRLHDREAVDNFEYYWEKCYSFLHKREIYVPYNLVYFASSKEFSDPSDSNGLAAGNCMEEAILHGLTEVLERHAQNIISYNKLIPDRINIDSIENAESRRLINIFISKGFEVILSNYSMDTGVPIISAIAFNESDAYHIKPFITHASSHTSPEYAVQRCLTEIAQGRASLLYLESTNLSFPKRIEMDLELKEEIERRRKGRPINLSDINSLEKMDIKDEIERIIALLLRKGHDVLVADLTHPELKIPTVRVIITGTQPAIYEIGVDINHDVARISDLIIR